ncbi:hypothetical protein ACJX0J_007792, partial [Zea mays]
YTIEITDFKLRKIRILLEKEDIFIFTYYNHVKYLIVGFMGHSFTVLGRDWSATSGIKREQEQSRWN